MRLNSENNVPSGSIEKNKSRMKRLSIFIGVFGQVVY